MITKITPDVKAAFWRFLPVDSGQKLCVMILNIVHVEVLYEYGGHIQRGNTESKPGADPAAGLVRCQHPLRGGGLRRVAAAAGVRFGYHFGKAASAASENI